MLHPTCCLRALCGWGLIFQSNDISDQVVMWWPRDQCVLDAGAPPTFPFPLDLVPHPLQEVLPFPLCLECEVLHILCNLHLGPQITGAQGPRRCVIGLEAHQVFDRSQKREEIFLISMNCVVVLWLPCDCMLQQLAKSWMIILPELHMFCVVNSRGRTEMTWDSFSRAPLHSSANPKVNTVRKALSLF